MRREKRGTAKFSHIFGRVFSKLGDLESLGFIGSSLPTARCSQPESSHLHTPTNSSDHFICRPSSVETPLLDSPMASPFLVTLGAVCSQ